MENRRPASSLLLLPRFLLGFGLFLTPSPVFSFQDDGNSKLSAVEESKQPEVKVDIPSEFPKLFWTDIKTVGNSSLSFVTRDWKTKDWQLMTAFTTCLGIAFSLDQKAENWALSGKSCNINPIAKNLSRLGGMEGLILVGGVYACGSGFKLDKLRGISADALISMLLATGIVEPVKYIAGRSRPRDENGNHHYAFGNGKSLPSGHSARVFAMATVAASHADSAWVAGAAYGLAGLAAFSRVQQRNHYLSDVAMGAIIGWLTGKSVVNSNELIRLGKNKQIAVDIEPNATTSSTGLSVSIRF